MKTVLTWLDAHFETLLISALLVGITVLSTLQVVLRYCFASSLSWVEEVIVYFNVWIGFIGCGYAILHDNNLRVDMSDLLPMRAATILKAAGNFITFVFYIYIAYCGVEVLNKTMASHQVSPGAEIPVTFLYASFFFGAILAAVRYMQRVYRFFTQSRPL
ncbi:conserved membrane hypothetical protein [uncultured delta proteobacterium]|uniref:Tripartite ATP-independent periplasmic transporters DctQ component domain-containing protein n=1 Tax=uncultured delta proteobacterium TaxID=34034 RepID=A0A212K2I8_9DELT|nr:conserved membrane hypothetical protein [uncultured delta proteobacterium]